MKSNLPNKFLDVEIDYMKEIRETYFQIKEEDLSEDEKNGSILLRQKKNPYEISEQVNITTEKD